MSNGISILNLCEETKPQLDPVSLRRIFLLLTRNHFADPENNYGGVPKAFKSFKYSDNDKERTLHIDLDYDYDEAQTEKRPIIFVGIKDFIFSKEVIDNFKDISDDNSKKDYVNLMATQVILRHVAMTPDEALMLGTLSTSFFLGIRSELLNKLSLAKFEIKSLSPPINIKGEDSADTQFKTDLLIDLVYHNSWETNSQSHRIKKIKS